MNLSQRYLPATSKLLLRRSPPGPCGITIGSPGSATILAHSSGHVRCPDPAADRASRVAARMRWDVRRYLRRREGSVPGEPDADLALPGMSLFSSAALAPSGMARSTGCPRACRALKGGAFTSSPTLITASTGHVEGMIGGTCGRKTALLLAEVSLCPLQHDETGLI